MVAGIPACHMVVMNAEPPYNHPMQLLGGGALETQFVGDLARLGQECLRARARRGYSNGITVLAVVTLIEIAACTIEYDYAWLADAQQWLSIDKVISHASLSLFILGYTLFQGIRLKRFNTRQLITRCPDTELAQARVEIAEANLVQAVLTGQLTGKEHYRGFALSTFLRFGTASSQVQRMRYVIENVSFNCMWYLKREGMCREHADLLPWLFYFLSPIIFIIVFTLLLAPFVGKWIVYPLYGLYLAGFAASIFARLRINAGAGCYELAFYDELAAATQYSSAPSQDAPAPYPAPAATAQTPDTPEHPVEL
jgi:hypothetical protein